jgi:hypothetical protein
MTTASSLSGNIAVEGVVAFGTPKNGGKTIESSEDVQPTLSRKVAIHDKQENHTEWEESNANDRLGKERAKDLVAEEYINERHSGDRALEN